MAANPNAFLVVRRDDGFGDVYPLQDGVRYTLGRAPTNRIVLRDDLCSREHAEVFEAEGGWFVRDLGSLNGTHLNGELLKQEYRLEPRDDVRIGRVNLVFIPDLTQLPDVPQTRSNRSAEAGDGLEIKKRLGQTRYLPPAAPPPGATPPAEPVRAETRVAPAQAVSVLYRLALDMADAATPAELGEMVVEAIFRACPAEVGAVLALKDGRELEPIVYRHRGHGHETYHKVSNFVSREVLSSKQAVLAENVALEKHLKDRDSIAELRVASLICAPVLFEEQILGLLHVYRTVGSPGTELEFAL